MSTIKNALITRFQGGYRTDSDAASISANGRRESFLSLTSTPNSASTTQAVTRYLDVLDSGITTVRASLLPVSTAETPYAGGWSTGAAVTMPRLSNALAGESMVVRSITVDEDDATGVLSFTPELVRPASTRFEQADGQLRQLNSGTLNGRSASATIAGDLDNDVRAGRVRTFEQTFSKDTLEASISPPWTPSEYMRMQSALVQLRTAGTTSTTLQVRVGGSAQTFSQSGGTTSSTITLAANRSGVFCMTTSNVRVTPEQQVSVEILTFGTGAVGLTVQVAFGED